MSSTTAAERPDPSRGSGLRNPGERTTESAERVSPDRGGRGRVDRGRRGLLKANPLAALALAGSGTASARTLEQAFGTAAPGNGSRKAFPDVIPLPDGFQPEGIVAGRGTEFFVGSLADGAVYRGDLRTGEGEILVEGTEGRISVGLSYDSRSDHLFVAGGTTGEAYVYDAETGEEVGDFDFSGGFVNDVAVTRTAVYFTDSFAPVLYRVPLGPAGRLPEQSTVEEVPLGGDFVQVPGFFVFNANGIDAPPDGEYLIVVNSTLGTLYRVDPETGEASLIDLGGDDVSSGDGILLDGKTLYVVRNTRNEIAVVELGPGATGGELVGTITDDDFDVPTTVAGFGNALYAVNARFGTADPQSAEYDVVKVSK